MADLEQQIADYLDATEDVDGHPIKRRDLAYSNQRQYVIIRGGAVVHCLDLHKGYEGLNVQKIFSIFRDEAYRDCSCPLIK